MDITQERTVQAGVAGEVRAWLGRRGLSGRAVARELGWTETYLSRRLTGAVAFDVADLARIARLLDVPVTVFFDMPGGFIISESLTPATRAASWLAA